MIIGPNCGSSRPPITISRPAGIISSTSQPSTRFAGNARFLSPSQRSRRATPAASTTLSVTPPASDLCNISRETTFTAKGGVSAPQAQRRCHRRRRRQPISVRECQRRRAAPCRLFRRVRASGLRSRATSDDVLYTGRLNSWSARCASDADPMPPDRRRRCTSNMRIR